MSGLRVGLNLVYLSDRAGGMGRYAQELVPALLAADPTIRLSAFVSRDLPDEIRQSSWSGHVEWVRFPVAAAGSPVHLMAELAALPVIARRRSLDVVHGLANIVPPIAPGVATVVTLHDLIWWHHRDAMPRHSRAVQRALTPLSARRSDRVITPSEATRRDVVETLRLDPAKVSAVAHGAPVDSSAAPIEEGELRERFGLRDRRVVLCVAQLRPYKNLAALVEAMAALARNDVALAICGPPSDHASELRSLAGRLGVQDLMTLTGWVTDAELEGLYQLAECVALPSLAEGFGLPVLEAMARGVPVACSNAGALPEVAGDAARLFDPRDPRAIAAAVASLLDDDALAAELVRRGREQVAGFTWERAALATLQVYRDALSARDARR
jgi:glycosyltransferase involved in cell wall biosynthesis